MISRVLVFFNITRPVQSINNPKGSELYLEKKDFDEDFDGVDSDLSSWDLDNGGEE